MTDEKFNSLEKTVNNDSINRAKLDYLKAAGKGLFLPISTIMKYRRENESRLLNIIAKGTAWGETVIMLSNYENDYVKVAAGLLLIAQGAHLITDYEKRQSNNNFRKPY